MIILAMGGSVRPVATAILLTIIEINQRVR
jgi:hypothetical protein